LRCGKKERQKEAEREVILRHDSLLGVRTWKEKDQEIVRKLQRKEKTMAEEEKPEVDNMSRRNTLREVRQEKKEKL
jgi:hypothetical protein